MNQWDTRYKAEDYVYGTTANDFLISVADRIPPGHILCLAEGEGRNAVFLAEKGYTVTAVDFSSVGLQKARQLASERGVSIKTCCADLSEFMIQPNQWQGIVSIFAHLPPEIRVPLHRAVVAGLVMGGAFVLEAYTPQQLQYKTGGPPTAELMMNLSDLQTELNGLEWAIAQEKVRFIQEGTLHNGMSAVVQLLGFRH
ncbi:class I SAM-dependent methyltransferase [Leptothermofonsia sichuanensis E412]|uniref:class I SAM-dependent methyltransferase n=1 Tax=Leptothermofonsia sichuanensis TaxID=2917832 RepID=UPI001CA6D380|nr:class I SAM-dependent methyltransferase [Leptothermofonsia sichuanensis]QZZ21693.1 class I SAM-dependent methyltransferase [Leptothermofonsia sichuanensis E412]